MIQVLPEPPKNTTKQCGCENCKATINYTEDEVKVGSGCDYVYIVCPRCKHGVYV